MYHQQKIIIIVLIIVTTISVWAIVTRSKFEPQHKNLAGQIHRIVSLSPSITAMIIDLGCENQLVGVTTYCPKTKQPVSIIGSITNPNIEAILALKPDIIFSSLEDSATQKIELLQSTLPVYTLPTADSFEAICNNYLHIAHLLNKDKYAKIKVESYKKLRKSLIKPIGKTALILLSYNPTIAVSSNTYISNIFLDAGFQNIVYDTHSRYPLVQLEYIIFSSSDYIITLFDVTLPKIMQDNKLIIPMNYESLYMYTPLHYCDALRYIVEHIY